MSHDLTGPDRHRSALDPPRIRTGPPWSESADPFRPCPSATPTTGASTTRLSMIKASTDTTNILSPLSSAAREG